MGTIHIDGSTAIDGFPDCLRWRISRNAGFRTGRHRYLIRSGACGAPSVSRSSVDDAGVVNLEQSIKDNGDWPKEVISVQPLQDVRSVVVGALQTSGGIARAADGFIRLLDNSSGVLFTLDAGLGPNAIHETGLNTPPSCEPFVG